MKTHGLSILDCVLPPSLLEGNMTSLFKRTPFPSPDSSAPRGALAQIDYIADRLHKDINTFRMKSFKNFGIDLAVHPTREARAVVDLSGKWLGFDTYYFDVYNQSPKAMEVWLTENGSVKIRYMNRWCHISAYLKCLKPAINHNAPSNFSWGEVQRYRWDQQDRWWMANGKKFRLMNLPAEIREIIYGHVIGPVVVPFPKTRGQGGGCVVSIGPKPIPSLLRTSKLINKEASNVLFSYTPFLFRDFRINRLERNSHLYSQIRHLELALSHDRLADIFEARFSEDEGDDRVAYCRSAMMLRKMNLSHLRMIFAPPSETTSGGYFDGACQKAVLQEILDDAWKWLKGQSLELGGFIKRKQKEVYEAACHKERKKFLIWREQKKAAGGDGKGTLWEYDHEMAELWEEDCGVSLDGGAREEEMHEAPALEGLVRDKYGEYPTKCACKVRCSEEQWDPED